MIAVWRSDDGYERHGRNVLVMTEKTSKEGTTQRHWISLRWLGVGPLYFAVLECLGVSAPKGRQAHGLSFATADESKLLEYGLTLGVGHIAGATVHVCDEQLVPMHEGDELAQQPPRTVARPLKADLTP